jgi:hypothetical protein
MTPPNSRARAQNYLSRCFPFNGSNPSPGSFVQSKAWRWNGVKMEHRHGLWGWIWRFLVFSCRVHLNGVFVVLGEWMGAFPTSFVLEGGGSRSGEDLDRIFRMQRCVVSTRGFECCGFTFMVQSW